MDFEVEGDDTDSYDYDWGNDNKKVPPRKSSTSFFGGDSRADEESAYDFSYHNEAPTKKKYEPFSPAVHSYDAQPSKGGGQKAAAAPAVSAMERAQSMLDKYSGKNANAPTSNFRNQKIRTFNEDDMSMSSTDEEPSDFEMSESEDSPVKKKKAPTKNAKHAKHAKKGKDINALDSKATVVVSMGAGEEDEDYLSEEGSPVMPPPEKAISRFSNMGGDDESQSRSQADDNEYSNDQFDQDDNGSYEESAEEVGESTRMSQTVDTEGVEESHLEQSHSTRSRSVSAASAASDSTRPSSPEPNRTNNLSNSFSPAFDNNNTSYSRIGYGNDVDESVEDDHDVEMSGSSKLKVFSFAELRTWEEKDKENQSQNSTLNAHSEPEAKSAEALSKAILDMSSHIITAPSMHKPVPSVTSATGSSSTSTVDNKAKAVSAVPAPAGPTKTTSPQRAPAPAAPVIASVSYHAPAVPQPVLSQATTVTQAAPQPGAHAAPAYIAPAAVPAAAAALPQHAPYPYPAAPAPVPPHMQVPGAYPPPPYYAAPPADPNAAPGTAAPGHPYSPYPYPFPYPYPPPLPPAYGYYPYAPQMPPVHPPLPPQGPYLSPENPGWAYPRRSFESWDPRWSREGPMYPPSHSSLDPRARLSGSYGGGGIGSGLPSTGYSDHHLAEQPLVLDLLKELRKSKEEADWAKKTLAETIVRLGDSNLSPPREKRTTGPAAAKPARHVHHADESTPLKTTVSPVQPVRSAMRFPAAQLSAQARPETSLDDSELPEEYSNSDSEGSNNDSYDYYSDDFEGESPAKTHTHSSSSAAHVSKQGSRHNTKPAQPSKQTNKDLQGQGQTAASKGTTPAAASASGSASHTQQQSQHVRELSAEQVRAQEGASSLLQDRERAMQPMRESLAHSLLASQELFKSQLESLRARISATNDYTNIMQQRVNNQWDDLNGRPHSSGSLSDVLQNGPSSGSSSSSANLGAQGTEALCDTADFARISFSGAPTLAQIQSEFAEKRVRSTEKLFDLLVQVYPNMTVAEAKRLAAKF